MEWQSATGFQVQQEYDEGYFQFFFDIECDTQKVLKGGLWLFKNSILDLQRWDQDKESDEDAFYSLLLGNKFWDCFRTVALRRRGEKNGARLDVDLLGVRDDQESIIKVQVLIDVKRKTLEERNESCRF